MKSIQLERKVLGGFMRHPEIIGDVSLFVSSDDFEFKPHQHLFQFIIDAFLKSESTKPAMIAQKITQANIKFRDLPSEPFDYLESLHSISIDAKTTLDLCKLLKKQSFVRDMVEACGNIQTKLSSLDLGQSSMSDIVQAADEIYAKTSLGVSADVEEIIDVFRDFEILMKDRAANPLEDIGYMGPHQTVNNLYGSLVRPRNISMIAARTGVGKTSIGLQYMNHYIEYDDCVVLNMDNGEMYLDDYMNRLTTFFTGNIIPYHFIETGLWGKNERFTEAMEQAWIKANTRKDRFFYCSAAHLNQDQIIQRIRRFYFTKIANKNKKLIIHYDYLKPFEGVREAEFAVLGHFMQKIKTLINNEIEAAFWTSIQMNRSGITGNKRAEDVDDTENTYGISDRIVQQTTHSFSMRYKVPEEIARYQNYGEFNLIPTKYRFLGKDYQRATALVNTGDTRLKKNFVHLAKNGFLFEDRGDLQQSIDEMGDLDVVDLDL